MADFTLMASSAYVMTLRRWGYQTLVTLANNKIMEVHSSKKLQ